MDRIKSWSHSRLTKFEGCKLQAKLAYIDKIPEPTRPLPPGKAEHANERGNRVHTASEFYIQGNVELVHELAPFADEYKALRDLYRAGKVSVEGEWAMDKDWNPTAWNSSDVWLRLKLDVFVTLSPSHGVVIDLKTGRLAGNEVKHAEQGQLYALTTFLRYPDLQVIDVEFWYVDQDQITQKRYTRADAMKLFKSYNKRGLAITDCLDFPANPNVYNCRYCPYGPKNSGSGNCSVGVGPAF